MKNILLVEDDRPLALGIIFALKKEGFNVLASENLDNSRKILNTNNIDIILLDVMLGDENGYTLCEELRERNENTPIIFMTACDQEEDIVKGLDMGADDYITKPLRINILISRINAVLRRKVENKTESNNHIFKSGKLTIDTARYKVYKETIELSLTLSEYKIMSILIENYPNTIPRSSLLEKVWDIDGNFVDANTLNVYVKRLRGKIEDDIKSPSFIETVRGVGYRWKCGVTR